jgi:RHS repeat-associated protein
MLNIIDPEALGYPTLILPDEGQPTGSSGRSCSGCLQYRPEPQLSGNLQIDPEIHLPSPGMDVDISYYYNAVSSYNGPFGYGRTLSHNLLAQASGSPTVVTMTRGNGALVTYQDSGGGTMVVGTPGALCSLQKDVADSLWKETTLDGKTTAYPLDTSGNVTSASYVQDAVGNTHTFVYSSGLLTNIKDAVGRLVTLGYASGLLSYIQDWANRFTTFQYDTHSASPLNLLTTVTGPTGCVTQYQHSTFALAGGTSKWLMSQVVDPNGYGTSYTYDQQGRVVTKSVATAGVTTYQYQPTFMWLTDPLGNLTTHTLGNNFALAALTNPLGAIVSITRNGNLQETLRVDALANHWTTTYDSASNLQSTQNPLGYINSTIHDAYNNPTTLQYADGTIVSQIYGYAGSPFDTTGSKRRVQVMVDQLGNRTTYGFNGRGQTATMQDALGNVWSYGFDGFGNQVSMTDPLGNVRTSVFDLAGNVLQSIDPLGNVWSSTYDNQNRVLTQVDPLGNTVTLGYDSVGNQTVRINQLGYRSSTTYNVWDKPVWQQDALGNISSSVYDSKGRVIANVDALGNRNTTIYDSAGRVAATQNGVGAITTTLFDVANRPVATQNPLGYLWTQVFDNANRPIASVDPLGNRTSSVLDPVGRQIASVNPLGNTWTILYALTGSQIASVDPLGNTSTTVWNALSRQIASITPLGYSTTTIYDAAGRRVATQDAQGYLWTSVYDTASRTVASVNPLGYRGTTSYDIASRPITKQNPLGYISTTVFDAAGQAIANLSPLGILTTAVFDADGRLAAQQDGLGRITSTVFDADGRVAARENALGYRSTTVFDGAGRSIATIDALGNRQTTIFDVASRVIGQMDALGFITSPIYDAASHPVASLDALGRLSTQVFDNASRVIASVNALGGIASTTFDAANRPIMTTDQLARVSTTVYDLASRRIASVNPLGIRNSTTFDALNRTVGQTNGLGYTWSQVFDAAGRNVQSIGPLGYLTTRTFSAADQPLTTENMLGYLVSSRSYDPAGRLAAVANGIGALTSTVYNNADEMVASISPLGFRQSMTFDLASRQIAQQNELGFLTSFVLDATGRRIAVIDARSNVTSTVFNGRGDLIATQDALGIYTSFQFDPDGNQTLRTDGRNWPTTYQYDALNRQVGVQYLNGQLVTNTYDAASELTVTADWTGLTTTVYDRVGNTSQVYSPAGIFIRYAYDGANQVTGVEDSKEGWTTYTRDANGNAIQAINAYNEWYTMVYDTRNILAGILKASMGTTITVDGAGREIGRKDWLPATGAVIAQYTNTWDAASRITAVTELNSLWTLTNDASGQLINEQRSGAVTYNTTYVYDAVGNRLQKNDSGSVTNYQYGPSNELTLLTPPSGAPTTSSYDNNGNLALETTGSQRTSYTWDGENRLLGVVYPAGTIDTYTYLADGRRVQALTSAYTLQYVWDNQKVRIAVLPGTTTAQGYYTSTPGEYGLNLSQRNTNVTTSYYGTDVQNSVRILVSSAGVITDNYTYKAFGEEALTSGTTKNYMRYVGGLGYYRDYATRLYVRARHLRSDLGRWASPDPLGIAGGDWNIVRYVTNQPVVIQDPSGLIVNCNCYITSISSYWLGSPCTRAINPNPMLAPPAPYYLMAARQTHVVLVYATCPRCACQGTLTFVSGAKVSQKITTTTTLTDTIRNISDTTVDTRDPDNAGIDLQPTWDAVPNGDGTCTYPITYESCDSPGIGPPDSMGIYTPPGCQRNPPLCDDINLVKYMTKDFYNYGEELWYKLTIVQQLTTTVTGNGGPAVTSPQFKKAVKWSDNIGYPATKGAVDIPTPTFVGS